MGARFSHCQTSWDTGRLDERELVQSMIVLTGLCWMFRAHEEGEKRESSARLEGGGPAEDP
jgi:hypothetical protein